MHSLEKVAADAYNQGLVEALNNMNLSETVKTAFVGDLLTGVGLAAGSGAYGAESGDELEGAVRGLQNTTIKGLAGAGIGGLGGGLYGLTGRVGKDPRLKALAALAGAGLGGGVGAVYGDVQNAMGTNPYYEAPTFLQRIFGR